MNQAVLIGIDGGGSKTTALLADAQGAVLGRGSAGASSLQTVGAEHAFAELERAVESAFIDARRAVCLPLAACLGLAGAGRPEDIARVRAWAARQWPATALVVVNDAELALAAGTPEGWGIALICGTGSIVVGRDRAGTTARAGGWGYLFGDEGSGYAIGLAALRAVARAADGRGPATALTEALLAHWALHDPWALIARVYGGKPANHEIAALAVLVVRAAAIGDPTAQRILDEASAELASAAAAVARQLGFAPPVPCALAGGLIAHTPAFAQRVVAAAERAGIVLAPITLVVEPVSGAITIARKLIG